MKSKVELQTAMIQDQLDAARENLNPAEFALRRIENAAGGIADLLAHQAVRDNPEKYRDCLVPLAGLLAHYTTQLFGEHAFAEALQKLKQQRGAT